MSDNFQKIDLYYLATIILLLILLLTACQSEDGLVEIEPDNAAETLSPTATTEGSDLNQLTTATETPTETQRPTATPTITPTPIVDVCEIKYLPLDGAYQNPHENLDPTTNTTTMIITVNPDLLLPDFSFHWWWDTREFGKADSFNVGNGPCEILWETHQIKCEGLPLAGTENLASGAYEYDFKFFLQGYDCKTYANYQQRGTIHMDTLAHDVFSLNGKDAP